MPKIENQDTQSSETLLSTETALERFERERLSRRQALKKLGVTTAMATFAMFSVDDLAHMVGKAMQQRAANNKVVEQVAKELSDVGAVRASSVGPSCTHCYDGYNAALIQATADWQTCYNDQVKAGSSSAAANTACNNYPYCPELNNALYNYNGCCSAHCPTGYCAPLNKC